MGSSTKKTTSNSTSSATTTPNAPSWMAYPTENYFGQVGGLISQNWSNPNFLATPTNLLQQTAANNAANLPTGQSELGQSNSYANQVANAGVPSIAPITKVVTGAPVSSGAATAGQIMDNGLDQYLNPFINNVVSTTLAGTDLNAAKQQNAQRAAAARGAAFGGSRDAIASTELMANQERERAGIEANLRAQGFDKATAMALADAQMRTQVSESNASLATQAAIAQAQIAAENERQNAAAANQRALQEALFGGQQLDRTLAAAGLLSGNATTGSNIANNNVNTQANLGQSLWDVDQYNNASGVAGLGAIQGLLQGFDPYIGQTINGTESGTSTQKSSGGLLGGLGGLLSIVPGISSIGSLFGGGAAAAKAAQKGY